MRTSPSTIHVVTCLRQSQILDWNIVMLSADSLPGHGVGEYFSEGAASAEEPTCPVDDLCRENHC